MPSVTELEAKDKIVIKNLKKEIKFGIKSMKFFLHKFCVKDDLRVDFKAC